MKETDEVYKSRGTAALKEVMVVAAEGPSVAPGAVHSSPSCVRIGLAYTI